MARLQDMLDAAARHGGVIDNQRASGYLPGDVFRPCADLDGTAARAFLEANGYEVVENRNLGRNGIAITACGWQLSTNGYLSWQPPVVSHAQAVSKAA